MKKKAKQFWLIIPPTPDYHIKENRVESNSWTKVFFLFPVLYDSELNS